MRYQEFWLHYLRLHANPKTRALHFIGTGLSIVFVLMAALTRSWWPLLLAILSGYGFAMTSHFMVEKNQPAAFSRPAMSLLSDFRMLLLWCFGRLEPELRKAGVGN